MVPAVVLVCKRGWKRIVSGSVFARLWFQSCVVDSSMQYDCGCALSALFPFALLLGCGHGDVGLRLKCWLVQGLMLYDCRLVVAG